jgi:glycosyltransferase involved in cell wall biosynthesis
MYSDTLSGHPPRVSVVMPVYNGEKHLRQAINSILKQTFTDFEFIIIDDGSTDGTAEILASYHDKRIKLIKNHQNRGIAISSNLGLSAAHGGYIAPMDQDDISSPERLLVQVQFLDNNLSIDAVGSWYEIIDENGHSTGEIIKPISLPLALRWVTFFNPPVLNPTVMMRRRILDLGGQYDTSVDVAADYGLWTSQNLNVSFSNIQCPLLKYRVHELNTSRTRTVQMDKEGCGISQKTISSYLGKNIAIETVKLIEQPYQTRSIVTLYSSSRLLHQVYLKFRKDYSLQPSEIVYINLDLANKLLLIAFKNKQFLSTWLLRLYAIKVIIVTLIYDFVKNNHSETSRIVRARKDARLHMITTKL